MLEKMENKKREFKKINSFIILNLVNNCVNNYVNKLVFK